MISRQRKSRHPGFKMDVKFQRTDSLNNWNQKNEIWYNGVSSLVGHENITKCLQRRHLGFKIANPPKNKSFFTPFELRYDILHKGTYYQE